MVPSVLRTAAERRSLFRSSMKLSIASTRGAPSGLIAPVLDAAASSASAVRPSRSAPTRSGTRPKNAPASKMLATRNESPIDR
jgi:hypothetical protein